jgi:hypothetical protein
MSGIGADDGKAILKAVTQKAATSHGWATVCGYNVAVGTAIALKQKPTAPIAGQPHFKTNGIGLTVYRTDALIHLSGDLAMFSHGLTRIFENARGYFTGSRDFGIVETKVEQAAALDKGRALGRGKLRGRSA